MLDIGWQELFIISVLALIIVGPKDLPRALKAVMHVVRKARGLAREFQTGLSEVVREAELEDIKRDVEKATKDDIEQDIKQAVDPGGALTAEFDPKQFTRDIKDTVEGGPPSGSMSQRPPGAPQENAEAAGPPAPAADPADEAAPSGPTDQAAREAGGR